MTVAEFLAWEEPIDVSGGPWQLRDGELEDARWFTRADLAAGHPALPPPGAISARLIDGWFSQGQDPVQRGEPPRRW